MTPITSRLTPAANAQHLPTLLLLCEEKWRKALIKTVEANAQPRIFSEAQIYCLNRELPSPEQVVAFSNSLAEELANLGLKRLTLCAMERGASVGFALAVSSSRLVRRLIVLDATCHAAPHPLSRAVDWIERVLPMGLPLRQLSQEFNASSDLHRIHCPTLVMISREATTFLSSQSRLIAERVPNAWRRRLLTPPLVSQGEEAYWSEELISSITDFLQVPVKRPQKNLSLGVLPSSDLNRETNPE